MIAQRRSERMYELECRLCQARLQCRNQNVGGCVPCSQCPHGVRAPRLMTTRTPPVADGQPMNCGPSSGSSTSPPKVGFPRIDTLRPMTRRGLAKNTCSKLVQYLAQMQQPKFSIMAVLAAAGLLMTVSPAASQEFHEWKSKSGHSTRAALLEVDEKRRKIILLIPKEISFDALDDESVALARNLATSSPDVSLIPRPAEKRPHSVDARQQPSLGGKRALESDPSTWSTEQKAMFKEISDSPPEQGIVKCAFYLGKYEPKLAELATFHRNEWQESAFEGDEKKLKEHYLELRKLLGDRFLPFYWDVHDIMSSDMKISKLMKEAAYFRKVNGLD
jgi:hypothetical protein